MLRVGIDVGGTFTDVLAADSERGTGEILKVPTTPHAPQIAVLGAAYTVLRSRGAVEWLGHSTTIATNALLGQEGLELPRVVLVTTHGFRDVIEIGRQNRSRIYDLFVERPKPLVASIDRLTVKERIDYRGVVVEPLEEQSLVRAIDAVRERMPCSVAVCLLNSYANGDHERYVARELRERLGLEYVVCSSEVDPEYREYERFSTAVVSAALEPLVAGYLAALADGLKENGVTAPVHVMRSDGGMSEASIAAKTPAALIESGPASGVIAAAALARRRRIVRALSFDMGGTTAKAGAILDGKPEVVTEYEAAGATHSGRAIKGSGYPVRYPFVDLSEVSAGGGTIAWIDDAKRLRVGPLSAGADPGPACYGRSDRATVTDANVVLGRLHQTHLLGGTFPIDARRARDAIAMLGVQIGLGVEQTAGGVIRLIDAQMAKGLRIVTIERGLDPRDFTMIAFGGNGPLHACSLAEELGVGRVVVPLHPGLLSAQGLLVADLSAEHVYPVLRATGDTREEEIEQIFASLESRGRELLRAQSVTDGKMRVLRMLDARYSGQSFELQIEHAPSLREVEQHFHDLHRSRYGYAVEDEIVELVNARSTVVAERNPLSSRASEVPFDCAASQRAQDRLSHRSPSTAPTARSGQARAIPLESHVEGSAPCHPERARPCHPERARCGAPSDVEGSASRQLRKVWVEGAFIETPVLQRDGLRAEACLDGPAIIEQYDSTTYIAPGWAARVLEDHTLSLQRSRRPFDSARASRSLRSG